MQRVTQTQRCRLSWRSQWNLATAVQLGNWFGWWPHANRTYLTLQCGPHNIVAHHMPFTIMASSTFSNICMPQKMMASSSGRLPPTNIFQQCLPQRYVAMSTIFFLTDILPMTLWSYMALLIAIGLHAPRLAVHLRGHVFAWQEDALHIKLSSILQLRCPLLKRSIWVLTTQGKLSYLFVVFYGI